MSNRANILVEGVTGPEEGSPVRLPESQPRLPGTEGPPVTDAEQLWDRILQKVNANPELKKRIIQFREAHTGLKTERSLRKDVEISLASFAYDKTRMSHEGAEILDEIVDEIVDSDAAFVSFINDSDKMNKLTVSVHILLRLDLS